MLGINSKHRLSKFFPLIFFVADLVVLNLSFLESYFQVFRDYAINDDSLLLLLGLNIVWLGGFVGFRLYEMNRDLGIINDLNRALLAIIICLTIVFGIFFFSGSYLFSRRQIFYFFLFFSLSVTSWRLFWHLFIRFWRRRGFNIRNYIVFGKGSISNELIEHFDENPGIGYRYLGFYDRVSNELIQEMSNFQKPNQVDVIFCNIQALKENEIKVLVDFAENNLVKIKLVSPFIRLGGREISIQKFGEIPIIDVNYIPLDHVINKAAKRAFDVIFSAFVIIFLLSWLFPLLALLIKLDSRGPILFRQVRDGKDNKQFVCLKFRTMIINSDADFKQATKGDRRVTRLGSILRRTSLDELPQFFNVFRGEMSVVGPRPHPVKLNEQYQPVIDRFVQRHAVKPGITGLAQARGFRGETLHVNDMVNRVKLDRFYVKNWSMILDIKIILLTIVSIVRGSEKAF